MSRDQVNFVKNAKKVSGLIFEMVKDAKKANLQNFSDMEILSGLGFLYSILVAEHMAGDKKITPKELKKRVDEYLEAHTKTMKFMVKDIANNLGVNYEP